MCVCFVCFLFGFVLFCFVFLVYHKNFRPKSDFLIFFLKFDIKNGFYDSFPLQNVKFIHMTVMV